MVKHDDVDEDKMYLIVGIELDTDEIVCVYIYPKNFNKQSMRYPKLFDSNDDPEPYIKELELRLAIGLVSPVSDIPTKELYPSTFYKP